MARARKSNTHDPAKSAKNFTAAVKSADRELGYAVEAIEKAAATESDSVRARESARSINHLIKVGYWIGEANAERRYAGHSVEAEINKRLRELETAAKRWGNDFVKAV